MYHQLRYWTFPKILFVVVFLLNIFSGVFFGKLSFESKKVDKNAIVVHKTSGMSNSGEPTYYIEFKDSSKVWSENVKYGFVFDTLKIGQKAVVKDFDLKVYIFCGIWFINVLFLSFCMPAFLDIVFKRDV